MPTSPHAAEPSPLAQSWVELDAAMPMPGPLDLPTNVVLASPEAGDGLHRVRGHGHDALRRRLAAEFLAMGFEVSQARHDHEGGLLAGPWTLQLRPPAELPPMAAKLSVRGQVRIRARAVGAIPIRAEGDLAMEPQAQWRASLGTAGTARIGEGCLIDSPLSCGGPLHLGAGSIVFGSVRCSALRLGAGARLAGGVALQAQSAARPALVAVHRNGARWPTPAAAQGVPSLQAPPMPWIVQEPMPSSSMAWQPGHSPPRAVAAPPEAVAAQPAPPAPAPAPLPPPPLHERPMEPLAANPMAHPVYAPTPTYARTPSLVEGSWNYFELPARADLHLDEPQAWRLLAAARWLEIPSRETLREQDLEFEGRTLGHVARFGILRDRRHLHEVEVPRERAADGDALLDVLAHAPHPVQVRGRLHRGQMHLTLRAPDPDTLHEALARFEPAASPAAPAPAPAPAPTDDDGSGKPAEAAP